MARKRKASATVETLLPTGDHRVAVVVLKGSPEYRDWLGSISKDSLIPVASIVRDALAKWAEGRGYSAPPAR